MRELRHRLTLTLTLFALLAVPCAWTTSVPKKPTPETEWERLVSEAALLSRNFSPEERADLLLDILQISSAPSSQVRQQALDLFTLSTTQLRQGHYRAVMQKNALTALSRVDPERAAGLYTTQDTPDMWTCLLYTSPSPRD